MANPSLAEALGLHAACRAGYEERVRFLLEEEKVDVNEVDVFDSTPLYYAVYGGHESLVRLLLANGARCDPATFVGERCCYGALNDSIRSLLKEHNATDFSIGARHPFGQFLRQLSRARAVHDIRFRLADESYYSGCRIVLGARSPALRAKLSGPWAARRTIALRRGDAKANRAILDFLCTGRLAVAGSLAPDALALARALRLEPGLLAALEAAGNAPGSLALETPVSSLRASLETVANCAATPVDEPGDSSDIAAFTRAHADASLVCANGKILRVPSVFLRARSDVFDVALGGDFREQKERSIVLADVPVGAAAAVVRFAICGTCAADLQRDAALAAEVLVFAHRYLLPNDLLHAAAGAMADALLADGHARAALDALPYAYEVGDRGERLYSAVCRVAAADLETAVALPAFRKAVTESALSIQARQATDSIPLVDDIRAAVREVYNPLDLDHAPHETHRLKLIGDLLDELRLDG